MKSSVLKGRRIAVKDVNSNKKRRIYAPALDEFKNAKTGRDFNSHPIDPIQPPLEMQNDRIDIPNETEPRSSAKRVRMFSLATNVV